METPVDSVEMVELLVAVILNWAATQGYKFTMPEKPIPPVVFSILVACIGAVVVALASGTRSPEKAGEIMQAALVSIVGASGIHKVRSTNRAMKKIAENGS